MSRSRAWLLHRYLDSGLGVVLNPGGRQTDTHIYGTLPLPRVGTSDQHGSNPDILLRVPPEWPSVTQRMLASQLGVRGTVCAGRCVDHPVPSRNSATGLATDHRGTDPPSPQRQSPARLPVPLLPPLRLARARSPH